MSLDIDITVGQSAGGVSVGLFCVVEKHLRKRYRGKDVCVDAPTMNHWIAMLGQIESEYRALVDAQRKGKVQ